MTNKDWSTHIFCQRCNAALDARKAVWLALDSRTGTYTDKEENIPDEFNQGAFAFGKQCSKIAIKEYVIQK